MPSRFEPGGLGQLLAMRYGAIPIVTQTGGLADTVIDIGTPGGSGIVVEQCSIPDIQLGINRALTLYNDKMRFAEVRKTGILRDSSWMVSAAEYERIYLQALLEKRRRTNTFGILSQPTAPY